jgi:hypothetical protein
MSSETENYPTDCLVLRIDEFDSDSHKLDTSMYILYDANKYNKFIMKLFLKSTFCFIKMNSYFYTIVNL